MKPLQKFESILNILLIISYIGIIAVVLLQVFCRATPIKAPPWTEEASRYLMVYLVAFSTGFALKERAFVGVDTIFNFFPVKLQLLLKCFNSIFLIIFSIIFFIYSFEFYKLGIPQTSITMPVFTMNVIYFSTIIFSFLLILYFILDVHHLIKDITKLNKENML